MKQRAWYVYYSHKRSDERLKKLAMPSIVGKEKEIYLECAKDFVRNEEYMRTALTYAEEVEKCSKEYEDYVPYDIENFPHIVIDDEIKSIINKVYEQKFAKENSIGRKYYNLIMGNAKGRCPICGGGKVKNLDHFLPKSQYPLLCLSPINLIPTCRDCNMEKGAVISYDYFEIPFHPYLEIMRDRWVECVLIFFQDGTFSIDFFNDYDDTIDPDLWRKYSAHMRITGIDDTFSSRAEEELENVRGVYKSEFLTCGKNKLCESLIDVKNSAEQIDVNSWKAALYRALVRDCDEFCRWLSK